MIADPAAQLRLLDLQASDTALAQLRHRRVSLPELAAITAAGQKFDALQMQVFELQASRDDLAGEQRRLENDVDAVRTRAGRDEQRLAGGGLPSKELESLQHEITSLARRQASLEDELLEVMDKFETADAELRKLSAARDEVDAERAECERLRDAAFVEIDEATAKQQADRRVIAAGVMPELLALYEKVASANGGVGAAAVKHRRCEGCRLELAGHELTAVRNAAPDEVLRCENCRRILVRTAESGL
ncbi:MAG TPA: C4-type zinc ribbon domain-containing protein [Jatrophihabitantaceae bacterium]|nr:C4-type zinc ribbon domain-containing protein [Jatrophihabitantaceae bacterium]